MATGFHDHFSSVSGDYAAFRPAYPQALFAWLASQTAQHALAWDCATGSGQAALGLAAYFERVVATDASRSQIESAVPHPAIEYRVCAAESSGLDEGSVDLITVAQALHWFHIEHFFAEATRVLATGGMLAVWTYGPLAMDDPRADAVTQAFCQDVVGPYWPPERALVDSGYAGIAFPFVQVEAPPFTMEARWTLDELLGYVGTWSSTSRYVAATGEKPLPQLRERLASAWGAPQTRRLVRWPLTVLAGRP